MEIKGILFDKDGTLIDFFEIWGTAVHPVMEALLLSYGLEKKQGLKDLILSRIGVHGTYIDPEGAFAWKPFNLIAEDIAMTLLEYEPGLCIETQEIRQSLIVLFQQQIDLKKTNIPVLTDLKRMMTSLHEMGIQTGLVTTDEYEAALECMRETGIEELISFYGTAGREMPIKPDKELLYKAADRWNLSPEEIAVVGDTPNDMRFARNAGAIGIGVLSGTGTDTDLEPIADFVIDSVDDLLSFLEKMELRR